MARRTQYSFADRVGGTAEENEKLYTLMELALKAGDSALMRLVAPGVRDFPLDPADPASWRRDGAFMVPIEGFVKRQYVVTEHGPAGGYTGGAALQETMAVSVALEFTKTGIGVAELGIRSLGAPLSRTNLDAIPTSAMIGRLAALQCLVDRIDYKWITYAALGEQIQLFPARIPEYDVVMMDGRPPEPTMVDSAGVPWWRVVIPRTFPTTTPPPGRRRRMTPEALEECWAVYSAAKAEGTPTTPAVEEWLDFPSIKTVERWISAARKHQEDQ